MDDDEKLITAFRELHAELLALGGDQGRETNYSRAADRLSALKAERDRMAAALREIQLEAGGGIEAAREGSPIQHCFIAIHRHAAAAQASPMPPLNECSRAALSQEPTASKDGTA